MRRLSSRTDVRDKADERAVLVITLDRPEKHNAQDESMLQDLDSCWRKAAKDDQVKVLAVSREMNDSVDISFSVAPLGHEAFRRAPSAA